ncbi:uncharacterized protein EDB93DRAFT_1323046 [Suillus bovinus]|uniref:uncharacterized protein n=1 Tax=Suillus bovinus TaxID=48563 RepID=UPI001B87A1C8|nr:uncharacterized protein EDB93DRAFT_1323046 [Suillus bovinus]KAG2132881.1 hypothetical protein EDB93DRAFT_1323046 [Suillus bovinus]
MLSQFRGDKSAWPVYLSIGNIAKEKRRYLPATKLDCFTSDAQSLTGYQLFHHCLSLLLELLIAASQDGVDMVCADSFIRLSDFPEQCLVACCKENRCPKCLVAADERGDPLNSLIRDPKLTKEILERWRSGQHPVEFDEYGLRPVYKPFWANLPHTNIFLAFTPDLLHQLHKGVFKDHLVKWCLDIVGETEIDARFKAIPDYPGLRHFKKAALIHSRVVIVTRALLDFCYYARLHTHTSESLDGLENALAIFHTHKDVLQELTVHEHFNIPKLHQLSHYVQSIKLFGAADGFNTELPERLHINFAKEAYHARYHSCSGEDCPTSSVDLFNISKPCMVPFNFLPALTLFLQKHLPHNHSIVPGPQDRFDTFHQVVVILPPDPCVSELPMLPSSSGRKPGSPNRFDMALVSSDGVQASKALLMLNAAVRVAQVRVLFRLPRQFGVYPRPLAYVEWFTLFREPDESSGLRLISRSTRHLRRNSAVIHVDEIIRPCHLIPKMGQLVNPTWTSANVYELASEFYLNPFIDLETFCMSTTST